MPVASALLLAAFAAVASTTPPGAKPNIVLIVADDLGYGELGCYGQRLIHTPNIDKMAEEGVRFTQFYAGSPVCAPSRCCLITGMQPSRAAIRDNLELEGEGQAPLPEGTRTLPGALREAGYATAMIGKWGLGGPDTCGEPIRQGFDYFFGYNCQRQAHDYYPTHLWRNREKVMLEGNTPGNVVGKQYSHDLMVEDALRYLDQAGQKPFFLYLPFTIPHVALQVPQDSVAPYVGQFDDPAYDGRRGYLPCEHPRATYAGMISRMDRDVGRILERLRERGLDENTLVIFTSDNGATMPTGGADPKFFDSVGGLRGWKGSVYEGGIRVPLVARWPGRIKPGRVSDHVSTFWDVAPTFLQLAGKRGKGLSGTSFVGALTGQGKQKGRRYVFWEFAGYGGQQAVRLGDWKGVRRDMEKGNMRIELYNLAKDPKEQKDLSADHPDVVEQMRKIMLKDRVPSKLFPLKGVDP